MPPSAPQIELAQEKNDVRRVALIAVPVPSIAAVRA